MSIAINIAVTIGFVALGCYFGDDTGKQNIMAAVFLWIPFFFIMRSALKTILM